jgi:hypothetical protein
MKTPAVGDVVYFYLHGDRSREPCGAFITGVNPVPPWLVSLDVFRPGQQGFRKSLVRHAADPYFKQFPDQLRKEGAGVWDFRPCDVKEEQESKRKIA